MSYADRMLANNKSTAILEIPTTAIKSNNPRFITPIKENWNEGNVNFSGSQSERFHGDHDPLDKAWTEHHAVYGSSYPNRLPPS